MELVAPGGCARLDLPGLDPEGFENPGMFLQRGEEEHLKELESSQPALPHPKHSTPQAAAFPERQRLCCRRHRWPHRRHKAPSSTRA